MPNEQAQTSTSAQSVPTVQSFLWALPSKHFSPPSPPPPPINEGENYLLTSIRGAFEVSNDYAVNHVIPTLPRGFTFAESKLLRRPQHRSEVTARWLARNFEINAAAATLKGLTRTLQVIDTLGSYQAIYKVNPYAQTDKAANGLTSAMLAVAEMQIRYITAEWIAGTTTPLLFYAANLAGLSFPPTYIIVAGLAIGWGAGQAFEPIIEILRHKALQQLPPAPIAPLPEAPNDTSDPQLKAQQTLDQLFPAAGLATATTPITFAPASHIDADKFTPPPITINRPVEFKTTQGNTDFSLTINNPIGGILFAGRLLVQTLTYFTANSREKAAIDLNSALAKLQAANSESSRNKYLTRVATAAENLSLQMRYDPEARLLGKIIAHAAASKKVDDLTHRDVEKMTKDYYQHLGNLHDQAYTHLANNQLKDAISLANTLYDILPRSPEAAILRAQVLKQHGDLDGFHYLLQCAATLLGEQEAQEPPYSFGDPKQATEEMRMWWINSNPPMRHRNELQKAVISLQLQSAHEQLAKTNNPNDQGIIKERIVGLCQQLIRKAPHHIQYKRHLANVYQYVTANPNKALEIRKAICDTHQCDANDLANYADMLLTNKDYVQAESVLKKYLQQKPKDPERQKQMILCRLHNPHLSSPPEEQKTTALLKKYVEEHPNDTSTATLLKSWQQHLAGKTFTTQRSSADNKNAPQPPAPSKPNNKI